MKEKARIKVTAAEDNKNIIAGGTISHGDDAMTTEAPATKASPGGAVESTTATVNATQLGGVDVDAIAPVEKAAAVAAAQAEGDPTASATGDDSAAAAATNGKNGEKIPSPDIKESALPTDVSTVNATTATTSEAKTEISPTTTTNASAEHVKTSNKNPSTKQSPHAAAAVTSNPGNDKPAKEATNEKANPFVTPITATATATPNPHSQQQHAPNPSPKAHAVQNAPPPQAQSAALPPQQQQQHKAVPQAAPPPPSQQQQVPSAHSANPLTDSFNDDDYSDKNDTLLTMSFNQDGGCLAVGTGSGFRICNVYPYQETFRRNLGGAVGGGCEGGGNAIDGGIAHIEMLYRTNLLALTGHANSPIYPPNKVFLYDDHLQRPIGELSFRQKVLTTKLRRDRIVIVLRDRVYIYNFSDLALLDKVHTGDNPLGLVGISTDNGGVGGSTTSGVARADVALGSGANNSPQQRNNGLVLACPSTQRGQVRVELYGLRRTTFVNAHESTLGALTLSVDGSLLATASERGTVIRLFDTRGVTVGGGCVGGNLNSDTTTNTSPNISSSIPLREFRRGVERATISCLTFSIDSQWLGCASDHGTVHIFQTHDPDGKDVTNTDATAAASSKKSKSSSSMTGKAIRMLPRLVTSPKTFLVDGVQSYAQVRGVPHPYTCAFVPDREQTIAVAGMDDFGNGCLLLAEFGKPNGGGSGGDARGESNKSSAVGDDSEAKRLGYHRFFKYKSPVSQSGSSSARRSRTSKSKDGSGSKALADAVEGGAYIDDSPVDMRMNHISIGDENEDNFVPIDYNG